MEMSFLGIWIPECASIIRPALCGIEVHGIIGLATASVSEVFFVLYLHFWKGGALEKYHMNERCTT